MAHHFDLSHYCWCPLLPWPHHQGGQSVRLPHQKAILSPFVIKYFLGRYFETMEILFLIKFQIIHFYQYKLVDSYFIQWITIHHYHYLFWYKNVSDLGSGSLFKLACGSSLHPHHSWSTFLLSGSTRCFMFTLYFSCLRQAAFFFPGALVPFVENGI